MIRWFRKNRPRWSIGILTGSSAITWRAPAGIGNPVLTAADVTDRRAGFVADPFLIRDGATWYLYCEVWNRDRDAGEVGVATSPDGRSWTYDRIVLAEPFHLSYPQVFAWDGAFWMVPESGQAGEVRLYRAGRLPGPWTHAGTLLTGDALVDPTVFRHDGRFWMFTARSADDTLHLHVADRPTGPWTAHPANPVVRNDPRRARPAGRVVDDGGRLVRFSQDGDPSYGMRVWASEIVALTPTDYREIAIGDGPVLEGGGSGWNGERMHHVDAHRLDDGTWIACVDGYGLV